MKEVHAMLSEFADDELKRIPLLPAGARPEANATYLNLRRLPGEAFTAEGREEVGEADYIVPKNEVDYQLWNQLIGVTEPERTGVRPK
jgi:hypothetical protein